MKYIPKAISHQFLQFTNFVFFTFSNWKQWGFMPQKHKFINAIKLMTYCAHYITIFLLLLTPVGAQTKKPAANIAGLGQPVTQFADWAVFTGIPSQGKICYVASQPKDRLPKGLNRDPAFIMISFRPAEKIINEISLKTGFATKADVDGTLTIGTASFPMFMKGEGGWVKLPLDEPKILAAMKTGSDMSFKGTSMRGNTLTDKYSLAGLSQALEKAMSECK